jgi:hypothetical protein
MQDISYQSSIHTKTGVPATPAIPNIRRYRSTSLADPIAFA